MLMRNVILELYMIMDGVSIKIIQPQWNGIAKQRSKNMLMLNIILERCTRMDGALIEIIQQQVQWYRKAVEQGCGCAQRNMLYILTNKLSKDKQRKR